MKRREFKCKGEKEKYTYLNAEFQRISRRGKKDFLSDHCKEIGKNNRMGKTRDLCPFPSLVFCFFFFPAETTIIIYPTSHRGSLHSFSFLFFVVVVVVVYVTLTV